MSNNVECRTRQESELEAIQAIYIREVNDLRKKPTDLIEIALRLGPQHSNSIDTAQEKYTNILLNIKLPKNYPNVLPEISISNSKGLCSDEVTELLNELSNEAQKHLGEEMILDLALHAQNYLYDHRRRPTVSFYDEMVIQKQMQTEKSNKIKEEVLQSQFLDVKNEIAKKRELLIEEARKMKEPKLISDPVPIPQSQINSHVQISPSRSSPLIEGGSWKEMKNRAISSRRSSYLRKSSGDDSSQEGKSNGEIKALELNLGKNRVKYFIGESLVIQSTSKQHSVYSAFESPTGNLVVISEWTFKSPYDKNKKLKVINGSDGQNYDEFITKQIPNFETEFKLLQKLDHPNIVLQLGISSIKSSTFTSVYIVQEFIRGITFSSYINGIPLESIPLLRHYAQELLQGLQYLHSNNIVHRFLRDTSVFIDNNGSVKLTDYGLERKLCDALHTLNHSDPFTDKFAPSIGRGAKKGDVYRFGILILSLIRGERVSQNPPLVPKSICPEIQDFLKKCLDTNEVARWKASQLLEHPFLKSPLIQVKCLNIATHPNSTNKCMNINDNVEEVEEGFNMSSYAVKGHSRLNEEFEILVWLGKGGFGDVLKVRNKLDGGIYALKKIKLNPRNKQLNKKITREVKLLSQLNHENVVRYYSSWVETVLDSSIYSPSDTSGTTSNYFPQSPYNNTNNHKNQSPPNKVENSLGIFDNIENMAPPLQDSDSKSDWGSVNTSLEEESEDSSEDEADLFGSSFLKLKDVSDDIVFDRQSHNKWESSSRDADKDVSRSVKLNDKDKNKAENSSFSIIQELQFMYIQMEFCEKSTLRTAIDDSLYEDEERAWRLFREIVEGLAHIHQQGMIHRDLKPVNIFLDSFDHVKIGDFGLATTNIIVRNTGNELTPGRFSTFVEDYPVNEMGIDESLTSDVGTALYVAPELITNLQGSKVMYSQKVDIYSLGIVFFEMMYHPIRTSMERVRTISGIRSPDLILPHDFYTGGRNREKEVLLLRWLLDGDPKKRPSSNELLQSDYLPQMERAELLGVFKQTLSNPQSKAYKYLIGSCFEQTTSMADDLTYDMDILGQRELNGLKLSLIQGVKMRIKRIFCLHGGVEVSTPLFLPSSSHYKNSPSVVSLLTHGGNIVCCQHDLRVPFARYAVSNSLSNVKRWAIEKVYRERKVFGFHPRELYECAFDIISTSEGGLISVAETIAVVFEIFHEFSWMKDRNYTIRLGHTYILDAILLQHSIDESLHSEIKSILTDIKDERHMRSQIQTRLVSLSLPDQFILILFNLMDIEGPLNKVSNMLKIVVKRNDVVGSKVKKALHELQILLDLIEAFSFKCNIVVSPSMVFGSNIYSGLIYQVSTQVKHKKNKSSLDVIAAGGKYDALLQSFRATRELAGMSYRGLDQYGAGISLSLDLLLLGSNSTSEIEENSLVDVIICSMDHHFLTKEKITLLKEFWSNGISCTALDESQTSESAEEQCLKIGASIIIFIKEQERFTSQLRVKFLEKERFQEKKVYRTELVEFVSNRLQSLNSSSNSHILKSETQKNSLQSSESNSQLHLSGSSGLGININFIITDKTTNWKRRQETVIINHLSESLRKISKFQNVEVIGAEVSSDTVKLISSELSTQDKEQFMTSVTEILEKKCESMSQRVKKTVKLICDEVEELVYVKNSEFIILYSLSDNFYRAII